MARTPETLPTQKTGSLVYERGSLALTRMPRGPGTHGQWGKRLGPGLREGLVSWCPLWAPQCLGRQVINR